MTRLRPIALPRMTTLVALLGSLAVAVTAAAADAPTQEGAHAAHHGGNHFAPADAKPAATPAMDHGDMRMQGGSAPADARDPHAHSGGYTLEAGPYALGGPRLLRLGDEKAFATVLVDQLEAVRSGGRSTGAYDLMARVGRDYDRLIIKAEGEVSDGKVQGARTEALWSHAVATFWDGQLGARHDSGVGPGRTWLAFGLQGLAPYWFEVDATAYIGDSGRTALRLGAEYEVLLTQKVIAQPHVEANLYGRSDLARDLGKGLSDLTAGVRFRYEFTRQFAPYVGVEWAGLFGETADLARAAGERTRQTRWVAGLRFWF